MQVQLHKAKLAKDAAKNDGGIKDVETEPTGAPPADDQVGPRPAQGNKNAKSRHVWKSEE